MKGNEVSGSFMFTCCIYRVLDPVSSASPSERQRRPGYPLSVFEVKKLQLEVWLWLDAQTQGA